MFKGNNDINSKQQNGVNNIKLGIPTQISYNTFFRAIGFSGSPFIEMNFIGDIQ